MIVRLLDRVVAGYQMVGAPLLGGQCRFHPSCSEYARQAIALHGGRRGLWLAAWRVLRCSPLCRAGYDPVPERPEGDHA